MIDVDPEDVVDDDSMNPAGVAVLTGFEHTDEFIFWD